jgi:aminopeptidase N
VTVRVYSPLGNKKQGSFALECGVKSLTFYTKFFNVPYPLTKYDMIAIPDFNGGAMENWGLVT